jgi:hypothetical protein
MATDKTHVPDEIRVAANNGRNGTTPVPDFAELLLLDQAAGKTVADTILVHPEVAYNFGSTSYITVVDPNIREWLESYTTDITECPFDRFTVIFSDSPNLAKIIRGRTFTVRVMTRDERDRYNFVWATAAADGNPILL